MKVGMLGAAALFSAVIVSTPVKLPAAEAVTAEIAAAAVLEDRYPRGATQFADGVQSYPDLIYFTPPGFRPLRLDLYVQRAPSGPRPLVIYVHGGGWQSGHTRHSGAFANWPRVLASLAAKGYVVASVEYRLSGEAKFPAAIHDLKTAIRWLRSKSTEFAIDAEQVIVWGGSAGGQLAALAATSCGVRELSPTFTAEPLSPMAKQSDCVQGLVAWYGVFDFRTIAPLAAATTDVDESTESPVAKYLGCSPSRCAEIAALASPVTHLDARDPPSLLIHGEIDKVVPVAQSHAFHAQLRSAKVRTELVIVPAADHSFIAGSPEATRQASLAALARTFAFMDALRTGERR